MSKVSRQEKMNFPKLSFKTLEVQSLWIMNLYIFGTRGIELSLKKKRGTVIK